MPTASLPFLDGYPVVRVEFVTRDGGTVGRTLVVDSGFTGLSALALSPADGRLVRRWDAASADVRGALTGRAERIWGTCGMPAPGFHRTVKAICADLSPLALPPGADGIVGLVFLQEFSRWGAWRSANGTWQFELAVDP